MWDVMKVWFNVLVVFWDKYWCMGGILYRWWNVIGWILIWLDIVSCEMNYDLRFLIIKIGFILVEFILMLLDFVVIVFWFI